MANLLKVECFMKECTWATEVDMTDISKTLPTGMGKLTVSEYLGDDKADDYRVTLCPSHTKALLGSFKPKQPVPADGAAPAAPAAPAAVPSGEVTH